MNEIELMERVASGDAGAIRFLLEAHYDAIYRLMRHLSGSREDAEDLSQDVFLVAQTKGRSFSGAATVRTWLTRIAVNAHSKHRRRERLRSICHLNKDKPRCEFDAMLDSEWLLSGMSKLSESHRTTLLLHDVHGFSVQELAAITGSPVGTVKARLHYARKRLNQILICPNEEIIR